MKISSDVNTIFAYGDDTHKFHKKVCVCMIQNKRDPYVLLAQVKSTFIFTYKHYLTFSCMIIEKAIRDEAKDRKDSPSQTYKPSPTTITVSINSSIDKYMKSEKEKNPNFNENASRKFIRDLLIEVSIPELYQDLSKLGDFREKYLEQSEKRAEEILNKFLQFFNSFQLMFIEEYPNYEEWISNIKESKYSVFFNKRDFEDMKLAAEFLSYNNLFSHLGFFTFDRECGESINTVAREYRLKTGPVMILKA